MPVDTDFFNDEFLDPVKASQGQDGQNNAGGGGDWYMGCCIWICIQDYQIRLRCKTLRTQTLSRICNPLYKKYFVPFIHFSINMLFRILLKNSLL